jgi:hypothetical protein
MKEAKHFVDTIHNDFEKFLVRNKKDFADFNLKT